MSKRRCKSNKLNAFMIFKYFSKMDVTLTRAKHSQHPNAFCLCTLARFFLVHETPRVDFGILHVVKNLRSKSPIAIILAKTLNGLDAVCRKEATFFARSNIFCLGSQPSGNPVIIAWITFWFSTNQGFLYRL